MERADRPEIQDNVCFWVVEGGDETEEGNTEGF